MTGYILSALVTIINLLLSQAAYYVSIFESYPLKTEFNIAIAKYLSVSSFINTSIVPLLMHVLVYAGDYVTRIYGEAGLLDN